MNIADIKEIPSNHLAEQALLACIIDDNDVLYDIDITDEMFYFSNTREVRTAIKELRKNNKVVDIAVLHGGVKEGLQSFVYDIALCDHFVTRHKQYAQEITEKYIQRKIMKLGNDIATLGLEYRNMDKIRDMATMILMQEQQQQSKAFIEVYQQTLDELGHRGDKIADFGYNSLDKLKGYIEGNLIVIGARPKVGKSTFVLNLMERLSLQNVKSCLYSLEMTKAEVSERFVSMLSGKPGILLDHVDEQEKQQITKQCINKLHIIENIDVIDDVFTFSKIYISIRKKATEGCKIFFIDYLQLIEGDGSNANERISKITKSLKRIAQELSINIVILSQLNREGAEGKPQLQHLRDSGAIEQDANLVMLLSINKDNDGILCVDVAANRAGPTLYSELKYQKHIYTITD